jgi:hypothetical protein
MKIQFPVALLWVAFAAAPAVVASETTHSPAPVPAPQPAFKIGSGFDYSSGDYGFTQKTEVLSIPLNLAYEQDRWAFRATFPYIRIKGPATVGAGLDPIAAPGRPVSQQESGFGDTVLSGTYHAHPAPGELNVDFTGRVKFGTADKDKGLGTGETDFYAQTDLYQVFGNVIPFVSLGYRFLGSNATYPLKDGFYFSAGTSFRLSPATVVGAAYDWRSKIIAGAQDASDGIVFVSTNATDHWNILGYLLKGFNDAAPDYGIGGAATYKF